MVTRATVSSQLLTALLCCQNKDSNIELCRGEGLRLETIIKLAASERKGRVGRREVRTGRSGD